MKFKTLLVTFNIVIILSFLIVFFLPFLILDGQYMQSFWTSNWIFGCIFFFVVLLINILFLFHWKTLSLLEKEDWPALAQYLENEVLVKKNQSKRNVRLLIDSLILLGEFSTIRTLDETLRTSKPRVAEKYRLRFTISAMLSSDYDYMSFLSSLGTKVSAYDREWLLFFSALSFQLNKKIAESAEVYLLLLHEGRNPVVLALSAFLSDSVIAKGISSKKEALKNSAVEVGELLTKRYTVEKWNRIVSDEKGEMHVLVLGKMLADASNWLFK